MKWKNNAKIIGWSDWTVGWLLLVFIISGHPYATAQAPVRERRHNEQSTILREVQEASQVINQRVVLVFEQIKNVQEFMSKASMVVNGVVKNIQLVKALIEQEREIAQLVTRSIDRLNAPLDEDGDGIDDLDFLDKWKHIQILLGIASEADGVFELFKNVIEDDSTIMDDRGRLTLIRDAYNDSVRIKTAIKIQIRRINREIYQYRKTRREVQTFEEFFQ